MNQRNQRNQRMPVATKAHFKTAGGGGQRGAALVVALLLLLVITLLAVAGMNSAAVEFVMAGHQQHPPNTLPGPRDRNGADHPERRVPPPPRPRRRPQLRPRH